MQPRVQTRLNKMFWSHWHKQLRLETCHLGKCAPLFIPLLLYVKWGFELNYPYLWQLGKKNVPKNIFPFRSSWTSLWLFATVETPCSFISQIPNPTKKTPFLAALSLFEQSKQNHPHRTSRTTINLSYKYIRLSLVDWVPIIWVLTSML